LHRGYIKLWRRLQDSSLWNRERFTRGQAWVDLIMLANHKDGHIRKRGIKIPILRGEIGWSERELAKRWKWSRGKVRRFMIELCQKNDQYLVPQTVPQKKNVTSKYLIKNYGLYQQNGTTNDTTNGPQTDRKRYQNKNDKNEKNKRSSRGATLIPNDFAINPKMADWFNKQEFKNIKIESATAEFIDYWLSCGKKKTDWYATWRNGMRKMEEWRKGEHTDRWKNF